ncbi:hypothetical protein PCASD_24517 [Puccinia coronata f. sp. avenae]|uniref:Uncharacterized protein n=1 Tax=Puccinia coronata f. sp. avenae TaxID=200324 RepID=A0A2N5S8X2_9BASI|nr:hypothetical protein PCASD_24517 [Puccinia coronata f. sp. avenae]
MPLSVLTAGINRSNTAVRAVLEQPCSTGDQTGTVRPKHLPAGRTGLSDQFLGPVAHDQPGPVGQICPTSWLLLRSDSVHPTTGRTRLFEHRSSSRVRPVNAGKTTTTSTLETPTTPIKDGWVDLQCFRASNGPLYTGLARAIKPFLNWIQGVQIFFTTKDVTHNLDKLRIVGSLIRETNTLAFYTAGPPNWTPTLGNSSNGTYKELFLTYSTRVRTLQRMINLDEQTLMDSQLAEFVTIGLPFDLRAMVNNFELLLKQPFNYMYFEQRALSDRSTCRRSDRPVRSVPGTGCTGPAGTVRTNLSDQLALALVGQCLSDHRSNTAVGAPLEQPCSTG